ncbi:uncharacterized protein LOC144756307 [Lissotriton helveticus]
MSLAARNGTLQYKAPARTPPLMLSGFFTSYCRQRSQPRRHHEQVHFSIPPRALLRDCSQGTIMQRLQLQGLVYLLLRFRRQGLLNRELFHHLHLPRVRLFVQKVRLYSKLRTCDQRHRQRLQTELRRLLLYDRPLQLRLHDPDGPGTWTRHGASLAPESALTNPQPPRGHTRPIGGLASFRDAATSCSPTLLGSPSASPHSILVHVVPSPLVTNKSCERPS